MTQPAVYTGVATLEVLEAAQNYNRSLLELIVENAAGRKIVDFGAGIGTFAGRLGSLGFDVVCVEPDQLLRDRLESRGLTVYQHIDAMPNGTVDFIFAFNVLEHVEDHAAVLARIRTKLKPKGQLLVYVPAFQMLWTALDTQVGHHRRYTAATLRHILTESGFDIQRIHYADSLGFAMALAFRALRLPAEKVTAEAVGFYDKWLFPLSRRMDRVCHRWFGKNVFALCSPAASDAGTSRKGC
jgi:SAM-dependent methyltransferase